MSSKTLHRVLFQLLLAAALLQLASVDAKGGRGSSGGRSSSSSTSSSSRSSSSSSSYSSPSSYSSSTYSYSSGSSSGYSSSYRSSYVPTTTYHSYYLAAYYYYDNYYGAYVYVDSVYAPASVNLVAILVPVGIIGFFVVFVIMIVIIAKCTGVHPCAYCCCILCCKCATYRQYDYNNPNRLGAPAGVTVEESYKEEEFGGPQQHAEGQYSLDKSDIVGYYEQHQHNHIVEGGVGGNVSNSVMPQYGQPVSDTSQNVPIMSTTNTGNQYFNMGMYNPMQMPPPQVMAPSSGYIMQQQQPPQYMMMQGGPPQGFAPVAYGGFLPPIYQQQQQIPMQQQNNQGIVVTNYQGGAPVAYNQ